MLVPLAAKKNERGCRAGARAPAGPGHILTFRCPQVYAYSHVYTYIVFTYIHSTYTVLYIQTYYYYYYY